MSAYRHRFRSRSSVLVLALVAAVSAAPAATAPTPPIIAPPADRSSKPAFDLTGVWWVRQPEGAVGFKPDPPLKPKAKAVFDEVARQRAAGLNARDKTGTCMPPGLPLIMTRVYPIQIFQMPKLITIIYEYQNAVRWIWMDGRGHPQGDDVIPTYYGHSIGWWEGSELVISTANMHTDPDIQPGVPHTEHLHVLERIRLTPEGFVTQITMTDPTLLEKPWVTQKSYVKSDAELSEYVCLQEDNRFVVDENGVLRSVGAGSKK